MNDPDSIIHRLRGDKVIWTVVLLLSLISIAAVYSSSSSLALREDKSTFDILLRQLRFVVFGLTALYVCYKLPLKWYRSLANIGLIVSIGLLVATLVVGKSLNDAERWISIFGLSFQPAEIAKICTILYLAKVLEDRKLETFKEYAIWILAPLGIVLVLILFGSASQALLLGAVSFLLLFISEVKRSHLLKTAGIAVVALGVVLILNLSFGMFDRIDTAISRFKHNDTEQLNNKNLTPEQKKIIDKNTYQKRMAKVAISSVGILGKGPGKSTQRYVLPHPYSDFIYAIIVEEWGLGGGVIVLMLYLWLLFRCMTLAYSCTKVFSMMLVIGLGLTISLQALLHMMVNVTLIPVTGHTLPLVSLGGTSLVIMGGAFGIILSVSRTIEVTKEKNQIKKEENVSKEDNN